MGITIGRGKIFLGTESLRCPKCGRVNHVEIHSDLPEKDYLTCRFCGYKAIVNLVPILDKYGIPHGASKIEKREVGEYLQKEVGKI